MGNIGNIDPFINYQPKILAITQSQYKAELDNQENNIALIKAVDHLAKLLERPEEQEEWSFTGMFKDFFKVNLIPIHAELRSEVDAFFYAFNDAYAALTEWRYDPLKSEQENSLDFDSLVFNFENSRLRLTAKKCELIRSIITDLKDIPAQKQLERQKQIEYYLQASLNNLLDKSRNIMSELKVIETKIKDHRKTANRSITVKEGPTILDKVQVVEDSARETLFLNHVGKLLIPTGASESLKHALGMGFKNTIMTLKSRKSDYKLQLNDLGLAPEAKQIVEGKLIEVKRVLYQTYLARIIDVIGEKRIQMKEATPGKKEMLGEEVSLLNAEFDKIILKLEALPPVSISLRTSLLDEMKSAMSLGYFKSSYPSKRDFLHQRHYANLGYSMVTEVEKWLNTLEMKPPDKNWQDTMMREVNGFVQWAERHPFTASQIAGDMALTVALLKNERFLSNFNASMTAKAMTANFLTALGVPEEEPVEMEDEFKYRALADLCRYAPLLTSAAMGTLETLQSSNLSVTNWLFNTVRQVGAVKAIHTAQQLIPNGYEDIGMTVIQIARGDNYKDILAARRDLAMVAAGGVTFKALRDPAGTWKKIADQAKIWWETIERAQGWEKASRIIVQLGLPVLTVAGCTTLVTFGALGLLSLTAAIPLALGALSGMYYLIQYLYKVENTSWSTYKNILDELQRAERQRRIQGAKQLILDTPELKDRAENEATLFIKALQRKGSIPKIPPIELTARLQTEAKSIEDKALAEVYKIMAIRLDKQPNPQLLPKVYSDIFGGTASSKGIVNMEDLQNLLKGYTKDYSEIDQAHLCKYLSQRLIEKLTQEWLMPKMKDAFVNRMAEVCLQYPDERSYLSSVSLDPKDRSVVAQKDESMNDYIQEQIMNGFAQHNKMQGDPTIIKSLLFAVDAYIKI